MKTLIYLVLGMALPNVITAQTIALVLASGAAVPQGKHFDKVYRCKGINDAQIIQQAIAQHDQVELSKGTFYLQKTINIKKSNFRLIGEEGTVWQMHDTLSTALQVIGQRKALGEPEIFTQAATGDTHITLSQTLGILPLSAGDWLLIANREPFNGKRSYYPKGEFIQVQSVQNDRLNFQSPLWLTYHSGNQNRLFVYHLISGFEIAHIDIRNGGRSANALLRVVYARDFRIHHLHISGGKDARAKFGILIQESLDFTLGHIITRDCLDADNIQNPTSRAGHGISLKGCMRGVVEYSQGINCRHALDVDKRQTMPVSRFCRILQITSRDCVVGISTHGGASEISFEDCEVQNAKRGGFIIRGKDCSLVRPRVLGKMQTGAYALRIGEESKSDAPEANDENAGIAGTGLRIAGAVVRVAADEYTFVYASEPLSDAQITNCLFANTGRTTALLIALGSQPQQVLLADWQVELTGGISPSSQSLVNWQSTAEIQGTVRNIRLHGIPQMRLQNRSTPLREDNIRFE